MHVLDSGLFLFTFLCGFVEKENQESKTILTQERKWGGYFWWILKDALIAASTAALLLLSKPTSSLRFFSFFTVTWHGLLCNMQVLWFISLCQVSSSCVTLWSWHKEMSKKTGCYVLVNLGKVNWLNYKNWNSVCFMYSFSVWSRREQQLWFSLLGFSICLLRILGYIYWVLAVE